MNSLFRPVARVLLFGSVLLRGCVEPYHADDMFLRENLLVISAHITDKPGVQEIEISRSSHPEAPKFNAEEGCYAVLHRDDGQSREFVPGDRPGHYAADLDADFLQPGMSFRLQVVTPDGNEYQSDFDRLRSAPVIDSVFYEVEDMVYAGDEDPVPGIRFYVDFTYDDASNEYLRWELIETYEFHNPVMEAYYYPNRWNRIQLEGEDNSRICYITRVIPTGYSLATQRLNYGSFRQSLEFVPNDWNEQKLMFKYSLLVRQFSIGPEGYKYWKEVGNLRQGQGTIFDRQPALLQSNICNVEDAEEKVLGFFTMSGVQEYRAFASDIPGLSKKTNPYYCLPVDRGPGSGSPTTFPSYFARATYDGTTVYAQVNHHCVDCRQYDGSSAVKPDFW